MLSELLEERNKLKQMVDRTPTETTKDQRRQLNCRGRTAISSGFDPGLHKNYLTSLSSPSSLEILAE